LWFRYHIVIGICYAGLLKIPFGTHTVRTAFLPKRWLPTIFEHLAQASMTAWVRRPRIDIDENLLFDGVSIGKFLLCVNNNNLHWHKMWYVWYRSKNPPGRTLRDSVKN
jgi:hypothetical protein